MPWAAAPTATDVLSEFNPGEHASIQAAQNAETSNLGVVIARVVAEFRDAIRSGGYPVDPDPETLPLGLHSAAIAMARWNYLISIPSLKRLQTPERQTAAENAQAKLAAIAKQEIVPESPNEGTVGRSGSWSSENKLVMRTHPVPRPAQQFPNLADAYANNPPPEDAA